MSLDLHSRSKPIAIFSGSCENVEEIHTMAICMDQKTNVLTPTESGLLSQDNKERPKGTCTYMHFCSHLFVPPLPPSCLVPTNHKNSLQACSFYLIPPLPPPLPSTNP